MPETELLQTTLGDLLAWLGLGGAGLLGAGGGAGWLVSRRKLPTNGLEARIIAIETNQDAMKDDIHDIKRDIEMILQTLLNK